MPITCPQKSKIKMVVLTAGKSENLFWYSILDKDNQPEKSIVTAMFKRFSNYYQKNAATIVNRLGCLSYIKRLNKA